MPTQMLPTFSDLAITDVAVARGRVVATNGIDVGVLSNGGWKKTRGGGPLALDARALRVLCASKGGAAMREVESLAPLFEGGIRASAVAWNRSGDAVVLGYEEVSRGGTALSAITSGIGEQPWGKKLSKLGGPYLRCIRPAISALGTLVVLHDETTLYAYEPSPIKPRWQLKDASPVRVALSPDARFGVVIDPLGRVRAFDGKTGAWRGEVLHTSEGGRVLACTNTTLVIGGTHGVDVLTLEDTRTTAIEHTSLEAEITALAIDDTTICVGLANGAVILLNR